jgi:hypothetical protein
MIGYAGLLIFLIIGFDDGLTTGSVFGNGLIGSFFFTFFSSAGNGLVVVVLLTIKASLVLGCGAEGILNDGPDPTGLFAGTVPVLGGLFAGTDTVLDGPFAGTVPVLDGSISGLTNVLVPSVGTFLPTTFLTADVDIVWSKCEKK